MSTIASHPVSTLRIIAADIKLAHSVFAMPFALLAAFMAGADRNGVIDWKQLLPQLVLIILAMVTARTVAMLANRLLDREIDRHNPRTRHRAIPSGSVSVHGALAALVLSAGMFLLVCLGFGLLYRNWWPLMLAPAVLLWISAYGLFKRWTSLCHVYLGASLAISPIAAAIAINPAALPSQPSLWLLSGMVLCWVAGFDIIYALQDVEVDRRDGLHSMPARFGIAQAMWISRMLHVVAVSCLIAALLIDARLSVLFGAGVVIVMTLLLYEHLTVHRWGTTKIALAFFTLNGMISCVLGGLGIADILL